MTPRIKIDELRHEVFLDGKRIHTTAQELSLLAEMAKARGRVLSRRHLLATAWGYGELAGKVDTRAVDALICSLRRKLGRDWVETVQKVGYKAAPSVTIQDDPSGKYGGAA